MVVEVQALHAGKGRHRIDPLLTPRAEQHQRRAVVQLGIVELRDGRRPHHVALVDHHRVVVGGGNAPMAGDVLVQLDMHRAVFRQCVHGAGLGLARFQPAQRLRDRHLEHHDLALGQRRFRNPVAGLHDRGLCGALGGLHACHAAKETADIDRVGGVVRALVDHLEYVVCADDGGGDLDAAGAPAVGQRHLAAAEGHLVARDRHRLEQRAAQHALGGFVQVAEVVVFVAHDSVGIGVGHDAMASCASTWEMPPASCPGGVGAGDGTARPRSARRRRSSSRLVWKST